MKLFNYYIAGLVLLASQGIMAQVPDWQINPSDFSNSMIIVGSIYQNDEVLQDESDLIAAFIGGELAGVTSLSYEEEIDAYLAVLLVYSNSNGAEISFKAYNSISNTEYDIPGTLTFEIDGLIGNAIDPYKWSDQEVGSEAELSSFDLENSFGDVEINGTDISVNVLDGSSLNMVATFGLSSGARARIGTVIQESGITSNDYSEPVEFTVVAEDGTAFTVYTITVTILTILSAEEENGQDLSFYPNPVNNHMTLINADQTENLLEIYDLFGQLKYQMTIESQQQLINVSDLQAGIYILKLGSHKRKFIKR